MLYNSMKMMDKEHHFMNYVRNYCPLTILMVCVSTYLQLLSCSRMGMVMIVCHSYKPTAKSQ